jgi:nitrogen regulatory protein PII
MVVAVIQPFKFDAVGLALERMPGFHGMTVSDVRGYGLGSEPAFGEERPETVAQATGEPEPRLRLEIAVAGRPRADAIAEAISLAAHTGRSGDGKVFCWQLDRVLAIRSFRVNRDAL